VEIADQATDIDSHRQSGRDFARFWVQPALDEQQ
jgi:hypothetical protein